MMKSHVFCNSAGVYMVCTSKLSEPDLSRSMSKHVTHKLQNELFSHGAVSDDDISLPADKVSPIWTLLIMGEDYMQGPPSYQNCLKCMKMSYNAKILFNLKTIDIYINLVFYHSYLVWEFLPTLMLYLHDLSDLASRGLGQSDVKQYPTSRK